MISVALFVMVLYALTSSLVNSTAMFGHSVSLVGSLQPIRMVISRLDSDFITSRGYLQGSSTTKLVMDGVTYEYISGKLKRTEGGDTYFITDENELKAFRFRYIGPRCIAVEMTSKAGRMYKYEITARN